jgi:hypothetical protein
MQLPVPVVALYFPASHTAHATPSEAAVYPAKHLQSFSPSLPDAELVCEGHAVQLPVPVVTLYVPASHTAHATPSDVPLCPAKHVQSVNSSLADAELLVPAGHTEH